MTAALDLELHAWITGTRSLRRHIRHRSHVIVNAMRLCWDGVLRLCAAGFALRGAVGSLEAGCHGTRPGNAGQRLRCPPVQQLRAAYSQFSALSTSS